jgi:predicted transcriptional regulator
MDTARTLRHARRRKGLSQRALAALTGIPQPTIARIEAGHVSPRVATLERLLLACDEEIRVRPLRGRGIDLSLSRELSRLTPRERVESIAAAAEELARSRQAAS